MPAKEFPPEVYEHPDEWVALTFEDKFVSHGKTPEECIAAAAEKGRALDEVVLLYVPEDLWRTTRI